MTERARIRMNESAIRHLQRGVAIVGLGNWGTSLACALNSAHIPLREVIVHSSPAAARKSCGFPITTLERARLDAAIVWLCVPDSAISETTRLLIEHRRSERSQDRRRRGRVAQSGRLLQGQILVHSSGALNVSALEQAAKAGAAVASVHPVMTFPTRTPVPLAGVSFGIEADVATRRKLTALVRKLGGQPFAISGSGKALYHAASMLASPLLVSLMAGAWQAANLAGLTPRQTRGLLEPIAQVTLRNFFARGAENSFSGPIARGDVAAIRLHLQALMPHPMLANLYRALALHALEALPGRNPEEVQRVLERFRNDAASVVPTQRERLAQPALKRKGARH